MYVDFTACAMDQIINQVAKIRYMSGGAARVPLVIRTQGGGGRGNAAQHSQSLEALFFHIPGLKLVMPATPRDARGLLKTAVRSDDPVMFIEHKRLYSTKGEVPAEEDLIPFGKAVTRRQGTDISVVATSFMVLQAMEAADELAGEGIELEVIDPRSLVPLDLDCIVESVRKTGRLIVVHEGCRRGGIGAEIACRVTETAFDYLDAPAVRIGAWDVPVPFSLPLESAVLPDAESVKTAARDLMEGRV
jgi:pyruvate/2-oxoglutarate/acetoin dehydrogenase E1 component